VSIWFKIREGREILIERQEEKNREMKAYKILCIRFYDMRDFSQEKMKIIFLIFIIFKVILNMSLYLPKKKNSL
jgi:hypothetical protein